MNGLNFPTAGLGLGIFTIDLVDLITTFQPSDLIFLSNAFSTRKVHEAHGESDMERIDGEVINHLWNMHKSEVSRKIQEQKAIEIASKPGQLRLL